jgi:hypothetical protein
VSRLKFAPGLKDVRLASAARGEFEFAPAPAEAVSYEALRASVDGAGYTLNSAEIVVAGTLDFTAGRWSVVAGRSGQRFTLEGRNLTKILAGEPPGRRLEVTGGWKTSGKGERAHEVITPRAVKALGTEP